MTHFNGNINSALILMDLVIADIKESGTDNSELSSDIDVAREALMRFINDEMSD